MLQKTIIIVVLLLSSAAWADIQDDISQLAREKSQLTREGIKLLRENHINAADDPEYAKASAAAMAASQKFVKLRKNQPELKPINQKSDAAMAAMMAAMKSKDKAAKDAAMQEYRNAQQELASQSKKFPEIVAAQKASIEANDAAKVAKLQLITDLPEGKVYIQKIKALDKQIAELQKRL